MRKKDFIDELPAENVRAIAMPIRALAIKQEIRDINSKIMNAANNGKLELTLYYNEVIEEEIYTYLERMKYGYSSFKLSTEQYKLEINWRGKDV